MQNLVFSVSELNAQIRALLEREIGNISISGEISNFVRATSGHIYFSLKDHNAQLRCVYFHTRHHSSNISAIKNGVAVIACGHLSLYEARGDYQLIVQNISIAGIGALHQQFEALKVKLAALGLFAAHSKKSIPLFPHTIGIISSLSGAAIRDILSTLKRRYPIAQVLIYNSEVQGVNAPSKLIAAINSANYDKRCAVLILARGGGSIEDLWAFNDEGLAQTIAASAIPIISGIGHETDFTIADFVADLRAATPTAAAEASTPKTFEILAVFQVLQLRLKQAINNVIKHQQLLLQHQMKRWSTPTQLISVHRLSLKHLNSQLHTIISQHVLQKFGRAHAIYSKLNNFSPALKLKTEKLRLSHLRAQLDAHLSTKLKQLKLEFNNKLTLLNTTSPLATMARGYAIALYKTKVVYSVRALSCDDTIQLILTDGRINARVISIDKTYD